MNLNFGKLIVLLLSIYNVFHAQAGVVTTTARETAEFIFSKFGRGALGETVEQVAEATARAVGKHGEECLPLLRKTGPAGFKALEEAGEKAPDVIKLYVRRGDEAIWLISEPRKLAIFIKHGDTAADALLKHPGIADALIARSGPEAASALVNISRQNAQRLSMIGADGLLNNPEQSSQLLRVLSQYGDPAMDFIWRNKGPLTVASVMTSFLADPKPYIEGVKQLVTDSIVTPIVQSVNWSMIVGLGLAGVGSPWLIRSLRRAYQA